MESFSRPPHHGSSHCADPEASWGHRNSNLPGPKGEMFFGYYLSAATMTREETGPAVPELTRRITLSSCHADPVRALTPVLTRMPGNGIPLGDILADSGYAHRDAGAWALPLRAAGAQLVQDLHPHDRGPQGTTHGAIIANGNLYCPATPTAAAAPRPAGPRRHPDQVTAHDQQTSELARHKLGRLTADDADGYHRVTCPAAMGKLRCPLRPALDDPRPQPAEILTPPPHPPACCTQQTLTIPPDIAAKTRQKHDYPSAAHRRSYARRTAAERGFSTIKDPASNTISRGWCRLMGLTPPALWLACPARRPQPAHPHRLEHPPSREPATRRRWPATQNTQTPPENHPGQPHRTAITTDPAPRHRPPLTSTPPAPATPRPRPAAPSAARQQPCTRTQDQLESRRPERHT